MKLNFDFYSKVEKIFCDRDERNLNLEETLIERFDNNDDLNFYLVISLELSRQILISKSFISLNYFKAGLEKYFSKEKKSFVSEFFQYSPIFQEGKQHLIKRKKIFKILEELNSQLIAQEDQLFKFIKSRLFKIKNQLDFSKNVITFCLIFLIKRLLNTSNKKIIKSILLRQSVWRSHFDHKKFLSLEKSLSVLDTKFLSECSQEDDLLKILIAQSFIIMGYDPLVATICASINKKDLPVSFASDSLRVCPTSYTTRICKEDIVLNGTKFKKGSILILSLVPTKSEKNNIMKNDLKSKSLSFGLGTHMCVGKINSFVILEMAEKVWSDVKKDIPIQNLSICPDGAFLNYKLR